MDEENIETVVISASDEISIVTPLGVSENFENVSTENVESTESLETGTLAAADFVVALGFVVLVVLFLVACFGV